MAENSPIEWTDHTWSPWEGCTKVSPGCDHCYAEGMNRWLRKGENWGPGAPRRTYSGEHWEKPLRWNAQAEKAAKRLKVFPSVCDPFDNAAPELQRIRFAKLILGTPNLTWLLLTKRIGNAAAMLAEMFPNGGTPPNVWLGATVVNQEEADRDIPKLLATPARVRFLSMEPLLGPVDLTRDSLVCTPCPYCRDHGADPDTGTFENCRRCEWTGKSDEWGIDWVIVGGESGHGARPMHADWARSLRDQCEAAGVPFLFKQWGEWLPWSQFSDADVDDPPEQTRFATREFEDGEWRDVGRPGYWDSMDGAIDDQQCVGRVGKKAAGRLLDGRTHDEFPEVR